MELNLYLHATLSQIEKEIHFGFFEAIKNNQIEKIMEAIANDRINIHHAYIEILDDPMFDDNKFLIFTPLAWACLHQKQDIVNLLLDKNADVNGKLGIGAHAIVNESWNEGGCLAFSVPPLIAAVFSGNQVITSRLLTSGASLKLTSPQGYGPLHLAAYMAYPEIIQLLIQFGADVNAWSTDDLLTNNNDVNAELGASRTNFNNNDFYYSASPLLCLFFPKITLLSRPRLAYYKRLLDENACAKSTKILLDAGADGCAKDDSNYCPLYGAVDYENSKAVHSILKKHYPSQHNNALHICDDETTVVHRALECTDPDILFNVVSAFIKQITHKVTVIDPRVHWINRIRDLSQDCLANIRKLPTKIQQEPVVCQIVEMIQSVESIANALPCDLLNEQQTLETQTTIESILNDVEIVLALSDPFNDDPTTPNGFEWHINQYLQSLPIKMNPPIEPLDLASQKKLSDVIQFVNHYEPIRTCTQLLDFGSYLDTKSKVNFSNSAKLNTLNGFFFEHKNRSSKTQSQEQTHGLNKRKNNTLPLDVNNKQQRF